MNSMIKYPCICNCVNSRQSIDKQLFSYFQADPTYLFSKALFTPL
jgi:hypothetical protein